MLPNNIMSFWWEITSFVQLDLNHSLKWMQYRPKLMDVDEDKDVVVVMEGIPDTMVLMVVIPQILTKIKSHCTIRSGVILRQNKKMVSVYKINLPRTMGTIVIDVVWKGIGCVHLIHAQLVSQLICVQLVFLDWGSDQQNLYL